MEEGEGNSPPDTKKRKKDKYKIKKKIKCSHIKVISQNNSVDYTKYNTKLFIQKPYAYPSPVTWDTEPIFWLHLLFSI